MGLCGSSSVAVKSDVTHSPTRPPKSGVHSKDIPPQTTSDSQSMMPRAKFNRGNELDADTYKKYVTEAYYVLEDKQGYVLASELKQLIHDIDPSVPAEESDIMIREADIHADGKILFEPFLKMMMTHQHIQKQAPEINKDLIESFKIVDSDNRGYVATAELKELLPSMNEKLTVAAIEKMLRENDPSGTGRIYRPTFMKMMTARKMDGALGST